MNQDDFKKLYLNDTKFTEPQPERCPYCNRVLKDWHYEKAIEHINECAERRNEEANT